MCSRNDSGAWGLKEGRRPPRQEKERRRVYRKSSRLMEKRYRFAALRYSLRSRRYETLPFRAAWCGSCILWFRLLSPENRNHETHESHETPRNKSRPEDLELKFVVCSVQLGALTRDTFGLLEDHRDATARHARAVFSPAEDRRDLGIQA